jgi:DNA-binding transcriptional MerR regulator
LVGIEPVSNFILLEQYAERRDADTWDHCLDERLTGLPVSVLQVTSDEAKALIRHAEFCLGAHHSPDLFHVQHETVKATGFALAGQVERAEKQLQQTRLHLEQTRQVLAACSDSCPQSDHRDELEQQRNQAETALAAAEQNLEACRDRRQRATEARRGLSEAYHPIHVQSGLPQDAETAGQRLDDCFDELDQVAQEAGLSPGARDRLAKARRVKPRMQATIDFFWTTVLAWFAKWRLSPPVANLMREILIPVCYLRLAAGKASTADERKRLQELAESVEARARSPDCVWNSLNASDQVQLHERAHLCATLFQRSSSCVEGRNGHLALKHHALHQLSGRKLNVLTVLHNYFVRRADDSTAAERFYRQPPRDLFGWLLDHISFPARPRRRGRAA